MEFNNGLVFQWIYGVGNNTKPTLTFPKTLNKVFTIFPSFINASGSVNLHVSAYTTSSVTVFEGLSNVTSKNLSKGNEYNLLIIGI